MITYFVYFKDTKEIKFLALRKNSKSGRKYTYSIVVANTVGAPVLYAFRIYLKDKIIDKS
jgi:hypothetical protein